jgi:hypothetical protein
MNYISCGQRELKLKIYRLNETNCHTDPPCEYSDIL